MTTLKNIGQWIWDAHAEAAAFILRGLWVVIEWLANQAGELVVEALGSLPEGWSVSPETILAVLHWAKVANAWIDLTTGLFVFGGWSGFTVSYVLVKILRRCIPTLG